MSQAQVAEILTEIRLHHPDLSFECLFAETIGDKDKKTSLRSLGKTDFFTREVDQLLLSGQCRIAIHSAKDLPDPLSKGLKLIALTSGVDPSDVLVMRSGSSLTSLPPQAVIATSSERREEAVKILRKDLTFIDIRGTIGERIEKLMQGKADGVVVAEAALIRLGLTHLNRVKLSGETTPFQGQLAILAREGDTEMEALFSPINTYRL